MTKRARRQAWLVALWGAALGFGCTDTGQTQVLTGRIDTTGVVAIRAVSGDDVVTAAPVTSDGSFRIALPSGARYRLEVLTSSGVKQVIEHRSGGWSTLELKVCVPQAPFDLGGVGNSNEMCDPMTDPSCKPPCGDPPPPPPCTNPMDPNCQPPGCGGPNEPPCPNCMDPTDPNCKPPEPPSCGGPNEPPCPPPPCMDPNDPMCKPCMPGDPNCDGTGGGCMPGDPNCGGSDPNCMDPMDPETCKDPCVIDPMQCGCPVMEPNCWPPPEPPMCQPGEMCDPNGGMTPTNVPSNFGCVGILET